MKERRQGAVQCADFTLLIFKSPLQLDECRKVATIILATKHPLSRKIDNTTETGMNRCFQSPFLFPTEEVPRSLPPLLSAYFCRELSVVLIRRNIQNDAHLGYINHSYTCLNVHLRIYTYISAYTYTYLDLGNICKDLPRIDVTNNDFFYNFQNIPMCFIKLKIQQINLNIDFTLFINKHKYRYTQRY